MDIRAWQFECQVMSASLEFQPGDLVRARGREWVVLPEPNPDLLRLRPMGGADRDATLIYLPLEPKAPEPATFALPDPTKSGTLEATFLLMNACRLKLRSGAGPFRSFGHLNFEPRAYQLVPLMMALRMETIRLLIADDVGIGKTIEAGLIARELLDRGEITRTTVICPPHLCDQWQQELDSKFNISSVIVRSGTTRRLERKVPAGESIFHVYRHTVVSLDYIKSDIRRDEFTRVCPEFVIVDEAHTCVRSHAGAPHQRYKLLRKLARSRPKRNILLLTATPHSGNDEAFHNLLGLVDERFEFLREMPEGQERDDLRRELGRHFVQRRRGDIEEWQDAVGFPERESREAVYRLTGKWGKLFWAVLKYAKAMVKGAEGGTQLEQRMSWWAALALLRCISSSPAAAVLALKTRLKAVTGETDAEQLVHLEQTASAQVLDVEDNEFITAEEVVPAGTVHAAESHTRLRQLIDSADALRGPTTDPKLKLLIGEVKQLLDDGFRPVVFCRYIATAHYVGDHLRKALPKNKTNIQVITGEFTPQEREVRVGQFGELEEGVKPLLVATDCLSEGINLQAHFNAVIHYGLTWNPTRHEQREGRADRFGQSSPVVRTVMIYGQDNPVDGAVLRVILNKAKKIRKELGVAVPLPTDGNAVVEAIMKTVLLHVSESEVAQRELEFGEVEKQVDADWKKARGQATRTIFAQRRLRPHEVWPEWQKTTKTLGGPDDVERFLRTTAIQLGTPMSLKEGGYSLPVNFLESSLRDRLNGIGVSERTTMKFRLPAPSGSIHVYRAHPLVAIMADFVAERALDSGESSVGARSTAVFTPNVLSATRLFLLRLRCHIHIRTRNPSGKVKLHKSLLAEECITVAQKSGDESIGIVDAASVQEYMRAIPGRNMDPGQKTWLIKQALVWYKQNHNHFDVIARARAKDLLSDHRRVRTASGIKGVFYDVVPALPVDVIGVVVLMPQLTI